MGLDMMQVARLPKTIKQMLIEGEIPVGTIPLLSRFKSNRKYQLHLAKLIAKKNYTKKEAEALVKPAWHDFEPLL